MSVLGPDNAPSAGPGDVRGSDGRSALVLRVESLLRQSWELGVGDDTDSESDGVVSLLSAASLADWEALLSSTDIRLAHLIHSLLPRRFFSAAKQSHVHRREPHQCERVWTRLCDAIPWLSSRAKTRLLVALRVHRKHYDLFENPISLVFTRTYGWELHALKVECDQAKPDGGILTFLSGIGSPEDVLLHVSSLSSYGPWPGRHDYRTAVPAPVVGLMYGPGLTVLNSGSPQVGPMPSVHQPPSLPVPPPPVPAPTPVIDTSSRSPPPSPPSSPPSASFPDAPRPTSTRSTSALDALATPLRWPPPPTDPSDTTNTEATSTDPVIPPTRRRRRTRSRHSHTSSAGRLSYTSQMSTPTSRAPSPIQTRSMSTDTASLPRFRDRMRQLESTVEEELGSQGIVLPPPAAVTPPALPSRPSSMARSSSMGGVPRRFSVPLSVSTPTPPDRAEAGASRVTDGDVDLPLSPIVGADTGSADTSPRNRSWSADSHEDVGDGGGGSGDLGGDRATDTGSGVGGGSGSGSGSGGGAVDDIGSSLSSRHTPPAMAATPTRRESTASTSRPPDLSPPGVRLPPSVMPRMIRRPVKVFMDIDDTLFPNLHDKSFPAGQPYPGVVAFLQALLMGRSDLGQPPGQLVFVTARPQLARSMAYTTAHAKLRGHIPFTVLAGSVSKLLSTSRMAAKKLTNMQDYMSLHPECDVVWIGDTGQGDVLAGRGLVQMCDDTGYPPPPCFIHDIVSNKKTQRRKTPPGARTSLRAEGIYLFDSYANLALMAFQMGLITATSLQRVAVEAHRDFQSVLTECKAMPPPERRNTLERLSALFGSYADAQTQLAAMSDTLNTHLREIHQVLSVR